MFTQIFDQVVDPVSSTSAPRFTEKQGQYLAFIHTYVLLNRRAPAEADFQRFFLVTPPAVHQMIVTLERNGLISRVPGQPRSIQLLVPAEELPTLQPIKTSAVGY
jgi:DNA-binding MarR family transcriptional regulator